MTSPERRATCQQCRKPLPPPQSTGRTRRYCSDRCRSAARRDRSSKGARDSGNATNVQQNLTNIISKAKIDDVPNETGAADVGATDVGAAGLDAVGLDAAGLDAAGLDAAGLDAAGLDAAAGGRAAARALLRRLLAEESASPLDAIAFIQGAASEIGDGLQTAVQRARQAGRTWAEVGQVLGISRQAAFQRFGRPADPVTGLPPAASMLPGAAERGAALLADLAAGRWAEVGRDFDERIARKLDPDGVARLWARLTGMLGRLEQVGEPLAYPVADLTLVDVPLSFEAAERTARISYDRDGKVAGLHFLPPGFT